MYEVSVQSRYHLGTSGRPPVLPHLRRHHLDNDDRTNSGGRVPIDSVAVARDINICSISVQLHDRLEGPEKTRMLLLYNLDHQEDTDRLSSYQDPA